MPVAFGGLSKENDPDFTTADAVTEVTIKPSSKQSIEIPVPEVVPQSHSPYIEFFFVSLVIRGIIHALSSLVIAPFG